MQARRRLTLHDAASANVVAFSIAAAIFIIGSTFLADFALRPPGGTGSSQENQDLKSKGAAVLETLLSGPGTPDTWGTSAAGVEHIARLGILSKGATSRIDPAKLDAIAHGLSSSGDPGNGYVDYPEARDKLGLNGYDFHLRIAPVKDAEAKDHHGISRLTDYHVGYIAHQSAPGVLSPEANTEAWGLADLNVGYDNTTHLATSGDKYLDDATTLRTKLLPLLGSEPQQTTIAAGDDQYANYGFHRIDSSQYSWLFATGTFTHALALTNGTTSAAGLTYAPGREMRAVVGAANMTGLASTPLTWDEWVDTDNHTGAYSVGDYGFVEVSPDGGATWSALTNDLSSRSKETSNLDFPEVNQQALAMTHRTTTIACTGCTNNANVLVAYHWVSSPTNAKVGHGWIIDNVLAGAASLDKNFEPPAYDMLIFGTGISQSALASSDIKNGLRDYVQRNGGRIVALGGEDEGSGAWLASLLHATMRPATGSVVTDSTSPILNIPNEIDYNHMPSGGQAWDFSGGSDASAFRLVSGPAPQALLGVSVTGAFGEQGLDGAVILTSWKPGATDMNTAANFFANVVTYSAFHALFGDLGPTIPTGQQVASASRTATVDQSVVGASNYTELSFTIYIWPGSSTLGTLSSNTHMPPSAPRSASAQPTVNGNIVSWSWPVTNGTGTPDKYLIYRGDTAGGETHPYIGWVDASNNAQIFSWPDVTAVVGHPYYYYVTLLTSHGEGAASRETSATRSTLPGAPSLDSASLVNEVSLTWQAPITDGGAALTGYHIWLDNTSLDTIGTNTSYAWMSQDQATHYFQVAALNAHGEGARSNGRSTAGLQIPGAPLLAGAQLGAGNAHLTWSQPGYFPPGTTYMLYAGTSAGQESQTPIYSGSATSADQGSIPAGTTRYYRVAAHNDAGDTLSNEVSVAIIGPATAPTLAAARNASEPLNVTLTITPPADLQGGSFSYYEISAGANGSARSPIATINAQSNGQPTNTTFYHHTNTNNVTWTYTIHAVTSYGAGADSNIATVTTPGVPYPPTGLSLVTGSPTVISWTAPANNGGIAPSGYNIYRTGQNAAAGTESLIGYQATTTSYTDSTTTIGGNYYYQVKAVNTAGEGNPSNELLVHVATIATAPLTFTVTAADASNLTLAWNAPATYNGGTFSTYAIFRGASTNARTELVRTTNTTWKDANLGNNASWYYSVSAVTDQGYGTNTTSTLGTTAGVPYPPTSLAASVSYPNPVLTWSAPANNGGLSILGYNVYRSAASGASGTETYIGFANAVTTYTDSTAASGSYYYYNVSAVTKAGEGGSSNHVQVHVAAVSGAPATFSVAATTNEPSNITLLWTAPTSLNGGTLLGYTVYGGSVSGSLTNLTFTTSLTWKHASLGNNATRYYTVVAVTDAGYGSNTTEKSATTDGVPYPPTGFQVTTNGVLHTDPVLTWSSPANTGGLTIIGYNVYRTVAGGASGTEVFLKYVPNAVTTTDTTATNGNTYRYWVTAATNAGEGNHGVEVTATR